jgi:hypothetical protein
MSRYNYILFFFKNLLFFTSNLIAALKIAKIAPKTVSGVVYQGLSRKYFNLALNLYELLTNKKMGLPQKILYYFLGNNLVIIAVNEEKLLGAEFYYFNQRDFQEQTIHQGFTGVIPSAQGNGIATNIRILAISHFSANNLKGISSRVSLNNLASLKSNQNLGFKPVEKYWDDQLCVERYYLVCDFENIQKNT